MNEFNSKEHMFLLQEYSKAINMHEIEKARLINERLYENTLLKFKELQMWKKDGRKSGLSGGLLKEIDGGIDEGLKMLKYLLEHATKLAYLSPQELNSSEENK